MPAASRIDQHPFLQAYLSVVLLTSYVRYEMIPPNKDLETGPRFVTKAMAGQVIALAKQGIR